MLLISLSILLGAFDRKLLYNKLGLEFNYDFHHKVSSQQRLKVKTRLYESKDAQFRYSGFARTRDHFQKKLWKYVSEGMKLTIFLLPAERADKVNWPPLKAFGVAYFSCCYFCGIVKRNKVAH